MTKRVLLGMLTPSSNTILEPISQAMVAGLPEVSVHFSRFKVTEIALSASALAQFDDSEILRAAELLAHAKVDVIGWNGTSSGWLGFDADVRLCGRSTAATRISGAPTKLGANYGAVGMTCRGERHLGLQDNFSFSEVTRQQIAEMTRTVASEAPQAIAVI